MTTGQAPIRIKTGNALDAGETTSNVATNTAELEAMRANIDGKDVYPNTVGTEHLSAANAIIHGAFKSGSMMVGSGGVVISSAADGETPTTGLVMGTSALQLIKSGEAIVALDGTTGDATFKGTIASGSTISGTMSTGSIAIGDGGVSIGSSTAGIGIMGNQIFCKNGGVTTILIDGDTGNVTANRFMLTADEDSTMDMSLGSLTIGADTSVGGTTTVGDIATNASNALSAAATAQETADGEIVGFYQTTAPASGMKFGDIWIDTDYSGFPTVNAIFRYQDADGGSSGALAWRAAASNAIGKVYLNAYSAQSTANGAQSTANSKITTFYQTSAPTALATGDLWVDTDDGNKLYRWSGASWVSVQDAGAAAGSTAIQTGGYVTVDANKNITNINTSGITIGTATSGARVQINSTGVGVYNSSNVLKTWMDIYGFHCQRGSSAIPETMERASFNNSSGTETGFISSGSDGLLVAGYSGPLFLEAGLYPSGSSWVWNNYAMELYAGSSITLMPGQNSSGADTVYIGNASYTGKKLAVYGDIEFNDDDGTKPTISSGSGTPSSTPAYGSLYLSSGGSLWLYTASGWSRIYAANTAAATAHPS